MTRVAILWHMHQPYYEDLVTGEHILPWVRLHALKDYFGMVALLREFPEVRVTFNLVPSLLVQLEAFAEGRARDRHLELGLKPAADLTQTDAAFILEQFFHAHREHMIGVFPRYVELLAKRGSGPLPQESWRAAARFDAGELRDLQVLQKLAWIDPIYRDVDPRVRGLEAKGRLFTEDDKQLLREVELELLNRVIPEYREAAARGQVELSTSPFYHPILPLLCDTDIYLTTHPESRMPRVRFRRPEDAAEQLRTAVACHERLFGHRPAGLWPSEGSVSNAMVPLVAQAGFRWMATDELVLARTLGTTFERDADGHLQQPELLYAPRQVRVEEASVSAAFRDHVLSDLIGFRYAGWSAEAAAHDFCARLLAAGRRFSERTGGGEATIPIILDGENAWEHFPGGGRPFLRALYGQLSATPGLRTVTMSEACAGPAQELSGIFPGSWIDANFYIWMGHPDDHAAWTQLAQARDAIDAASETGAPALAQARQEALVAEGSDWFWWYGDDHSSDHDAAFDDLFRRHLRNVYRLLNRPVPDDLFVSNISTIPPSSGQIEPSTLIGPTIDGRESSYFEWLGAGVLEGAEAAGAMHQSEQRPADVLRVLFGFDMERLYVRVDGRRPLTELLDQGSQLCLKFMDPAGASLSVGRADGRLVISFTHPGAGPRPEPAAAAAGAVLEMSVPLAALNVQPGGAVSFFLAVSNADGLEYERHPSSRPIELRAPGTDFVARNWNA